MLKERGQKWGIWERKVVLNELSRDCTTAEHETIFNEVLNAGSIAVCLLRDIPKGSVYLFSVGDYSYFVFEGSDETSELFIVFG